MPELLTRLQSALADRYRLEREVGAGSGDDRRFLMLREGESAQESELIVAVHWLDGLKGKTGR